MTNYVQNIQESKLNMYHLILPTNDNLFIPNVILERLLRSRLANICLGNVPCHSRPKFIKSEICAALGYPIPSPFKKTRPCFPGQNFDVCIQQGAELPLKADEIIESKRYVILRVNGKQTITDVKVYAGGKLAVLASM